ncbi:MAG: hypothetical protein GC162_00220 [Planctomycetes bacterium]|nr:hypothetical protein [Planctomycetota bacterium]
MYRRAAIALAVCVFTCAAGARADSVVLSYHNGTTSQAPITAASGVSAGNTDLNGSESWRTSFGSAGATQPGPLAGSAAGSNWRFWRAINLNDVASSTSDYAGFAFDFTSADLLSPTTLSFDLAAASDNAGTINGEYNVFVSKNGGAFTSLAAGTGVSLTTSGGWAVNTVVANVASVGTIRNGDHLEFRIGLGDNSTSNSKGVFLQGIALAADRDVAASVLRVDFGPSAQQVETGYAPFSFNNGAASPQSRTYTFATTGYDNVNADTGSGITVTLAAKETALRMIDRGTSDKSDRDWATVEPVPGPGNVPDNYMDLTLAGLKSGYYTLISDHIDTSNQVGVMDVQVSTDGGATFTNKLDNVVYNNTLHQYLISFFADAGQNVVVRYLAGGGLFGANGQATDTVASNRLLPLNAFELTTVPEPSTGLLAIVSALLLVRRRACRTV